MADQGRYQKTENSERIKKKKKGLVLSKERIDLEEKIINADRQTMESHWREQRLNKEKVINSMEKNPEKYYSRM